MKTLFPEDLSVLSIADLTTLRTAGLAEFDGIYTDDATAFAALSDEDVATLSGLRDGLKSVNAEFARRADVEANRASLAGDRAEFAKVSGTFEGETEAEETEDEAITAGGAGDGAPSFSAETEGDKIEAPVAYATGQQLGVPVESPLDWEGVGKALSHQAGSFNVSPYKQAAREGRALRSIQNFARFAKPNLRPEQMIRDGASQSDIRAALRAATDQSRLNGGSLIAAGGWGAPSQISYTRFRKLSSRDGLATFPEVGVEHGGLQIPIGSTFAEVYASKDFIAFNEQQDIDGEYALDSDGVTRIDGTKPVYRVPPTEWVDHRLHVDGIHIQAGILENRGYPEGVAMEVAQVLDAHAHVINAKVIAEVAAGSTAISMAANQLGAVAPVLTAIDLQVLHYRDTHRMEFDTALEAKFPNWLKGVFRSDLARRLGVDLLDVNDARIEGWFRDRGVSVEWVYDWQSIAGTAAGSFNQWPATVSFLLYAAGTWIKGTSDVISLDTMYDSTLIGTNDYTIMFTEEGWFVAKQGPDSRLVTTSLSATGVTNIGDEIARSGAAA